MTRYRSGEALIFVVATTLMVVHALDDAFVHRQAGIGLSQHALAAVISVCARCSASPSERSRSSTACST